MEKMTPDAIALNRSTSGRQPAAPVPPRRLAEAAPARMSNTESRRMILTRTVQLQVIPQLLRRQAGTGAPSQAASREAGLAAHVERLAGLSLQASGNEVIDFVTGLLDAGCDADAIYLDLLTPTAQLLGQYWADDVCTFADVTIGVGHLQAAMRRLRAAFFGNARPIAPWAPRALLLPLPGEQHDFGCAMLSAFFARAGWDIWSGAVRRGSALAEMVGRDWIDLVGFSVSHDAMLDETMRAVAAVRAASCNAGLIVMVGGLPFAQDPSLAEAVGADGTALDGAQAVEVATALLPLRPPSG